MTPVAKPIAKPIVKPIVTKPSKENFMKKLSIIELREKVDTLKLENKLKELNKKSLRDAIYLHLAVRDHTADVKRGR